MLTKVLLLTINCIILVYTHDGHQDSFLEPNLDHIKEDVRDRYHVELDSKTPDKELDFYYFQMHDFDSNQVLDGLEILTAMNHVIDEDFLRAKEETTTTTVAPQAESNDEEQEDPMEYYKIRARYHSQAKWNHKFEEDSKAIDKLLDQYDNDNDGYISYSEYIMAKRQRP